MDNRLIEKIEKYGGSLELVNEMQPISYSFKGKNKTEIGLTSQSLLTIEPKVVGRSANGLLVIQYNNIIPILINSIKQLSTEIELLKSPSKKNKTK